MNWRHSARAKKNSRDGINLRIGVIQARIINIKVEIKLYERFNHTAFGRKVLSTLRKKLLKRTSQLNRYLRRKDRLKSTGQI